MKKNQVMVFVLLGAIFLACISLIVIIAKSHKSDSINAEMVDREALQFVSHHPVNAMIYGLWINGKPIRINAIGESMTGISAKTNMHFRIGGVTETMLTTLLMHLVDTQKTHLDQTIDAWFPTLPNAKQVTLKMLANGTSGYPDYVENDRFINQVNNQPFKHWQSKDLLDFAFETKPLFSPGTNQHYSHTDYVILGQIISKIYQKPLAEVFKKHIFKISAMRHSRYTLTAAMRYPVMHAFSQARSIFEDSTFWDPSWTSASGAVTANIHDLGKWAQTFLDGELLSAKASRQLRAPDTVGLGKNRDDLYFAMGFGVANHWLIQNPSFGGYSGIFAILPEKKLIFIAYNTTKQTKQLQPNLSKAFWQAIAPKLAPDYPLPKL